MSIRVANESDVDKIYDLGKEAAEFETSKDVVTFWPKSILKNCVQNKNGFILVAEDSRNLVGFVIINYNPDFQKATVENIYVLPDYRNQNIGRQLLEKGVSQAKEAGGKYICALVGTEYNHTIKFYQQQGFQRGKDCAWLDQILNDEFRKKQQ